MSKLTSRNLKVASSFATSALSDRKPFADEIVGLRGVFEVGIAIGIPHDLAALRAAEIDLDAALGQMPVRMGKLRQPKRGLRIGKDEENFHARTFVLQDRCEAIVQRDVRGRRTMARGQAGVLDDLALPLGARGRDAYVERR